MLNLFFTFFVGFLLAIILGFPILKLCHKLKFSQTILHYVDNHAGKSGTPTMGGLIFIIAGLIPGLIFCRADGLSLIILLVFLCYGLLGFLDDFIKIKGRKNEGLKPYQKIIGQVGISLAIGIFVYFKVGTSVDLFGLKLNLGLWIIPFIVFFYVAVTNAVNLTDGLDGLAGGVSEIFLLVIGIILLLLGYSNYSTLAFAVGGGVLGFLCFNCYPAKIFMGDTGSLALGGIIASLCVFSGLELIMPIIGIMFVMSALSDVIQVLHYKRTKRRVFKMAPLHHHFERCGVHENRIVLVYIVITLICGLGCLLGYLGVGGML